MLRGGSGICIRLMGRAEGRTALMVDCFSLLACEERLCVRVNVMMVKMNDACLLR